MADLKNATYVFVIYGGGWTRYNDLYVIWKDRGVSFVRNFGNVNGFEISLIEEQIYQTDIPKPLLHMEKDLDFKKHGNTVGFDAPECIMFRVVNGKLHCLYSVGMYHNNTPAVDHVRNQVYLIRRANGECV